jgi:hypothetical protein
LSRGATIMKKAPAKRLGLLDICLPFKCARCALKDPFFFTT